MQCSTWLYADHGNQMILVHRCHHIQPRSSRERFFIHWMWHHSTNQTLVDVEKCAFSKLVSRLWRPTRHVTDHSAGQVFQGNQLHWYWQTNLQQLSVVQLTCLRANSAFHPSGIGKWGPASAGKEKAGMVHSISRWTRNVQVKMWDPLRSRATPERHGLHVSVIHHKKRRAQLLICICKCGICYQNVCPSVSLSHLCLNGSTYQNTFHTISWGQTLMSQVLESYLEWLH